jgi:hypothetical protein
MDYLEMVDLVQSKLRQVDANIDYGEAQLK